MTPEREPLTDAECDAIVNAVHGEMYPRSVGSIIRSDPMDRAMCRAAFAAARADSAKEIAELRAEVRRRTPRDDPERLLSIDEVYGLLEKAEAALAETLAQYHRTRDERDQSQRLLAEARKALRNIYQYILANRDDERRNGRPWEPPDNDLVIVLNEARRGGLELDDGLIDAAREGK